MATDWEEIDKWISNLYSAGASPSFEKNIDNLQVLTQLKKENETMNTVLTRALAVQQHMKAMQNDTHNTQKRALDELHLEKSMLTAQGQRSLEALAALAVRLGIKNDEISCYHSAISKLTIESMDAHIEKQELDDVLHVFDDSIRGAEEDLLRIQDMLTSIKEQQKEDHAAAKALDEDREQLRQDNTSKHMDKDESDVSQIEERGLRLAEMKRFEDELIQLEIELSEKKRNLELYHGLPPDMELASLQFQECQKELDSLEQQRQQLLARIAQSVH